MCVQIFVGDCVNVVGVFGYVFVGYFKVDVVWNGVFGIVYIKEFVNFVQYVVEWMGFIV